MEQNPTSSSSGAFRPSRRTVAKGVAWSVPAVAIAVAAPARAFSAPGPTGSSNADACKTPGGSCDNYTKGYLFPISVTNNSGFAVWLYTGVVAGTSPSYTGPIIVEDSPDISLFYAGALVNGVFYPAGTSIPVPAGATVYMILNAGENGSSQNVQDLSGSITFQWGHDPDPADDMDHIAAPLVVNFNTASTPPCSNCQPAPQINTAVVTPVTVGTVTTRVYYHPGPTAPAPGSAPGTLFQTITTTVMSSGLGNILFDVTANDATQAGYYVFQSSFPAVSGFAAATEVYANAGSVVTVTAAPAPAPAPAQQEPTTTTQSGAKVQQQTTETPTSTPTTTTKKSSGSSTTSAPAQTTSTPTPTPTTTSAPAPTTTAPAPPPTTASISTATPTATP